MRVFRAWLEFLARQTRPPEDSRALRGLVALNVTIAILAVGQPLEWPGFVKVGLLLTWGATAVSYSFRRRNNWDIKAILSVLMLAAMANFVYSLSINLSDPRIPLAELLVYLQALHSFDLPGRRDLNYSLLVALVLMSIAAVMSVYSSYAFFLGAYALTAWVALDLNYRRALHEIGVDMPLAGAWPLWRSLAGMLAGSLVVLLCLPRFQSFRIRALPMSLQLRLTLPRVSSGQIRNASFPSTANPEEFRKKAKFDPNSYAGFNSVVDLQMRGRLSPEVVMHVRSSRTSYLRGLAFDHFQGQFWTQTPFKPRLLNAKTAPPFSVALDFSPRLPEGAGGLSQFVRENVQIIYVDRALPNLILAAYEPNLLYFPSEEVYRDNEGGLLSPYPMESGTVYSVISSEIREVPQMLKVLSSVDRRIKLFKRYLALPPQLQGESRVRQLAERVAEGQPSPYLKVLALVNHLHQNYRYNVDAPVYPGDADVVDYFLFEAREGYCEQFASALAVMARTLGLPSRYVTGYLPGVYNPLTGYHEIHGNEAHAWTEIWIPNYGWLTFDATPPGSARLRDDQDSDQSPSLGLALLQFLVKKLGPGLVAGCGGALGLLLLSLTLSSWWKRRSSLPRHYMEKAMEKARRREPGETPRRIAARLSHNGFAELSELHERERYQAQSLTSAELDRAHALLKIIQV